MRDVTLLGNVALASHGETQPLEALGHGDGAKAFQTFKLARPNLTYLQSATSLEGTAALEIRANGELLKETPSFFGRRGNERVYTARQNDNAETYVAFGDGTTGARASIGRDERHRDLSHRTWPSGPDEGRTNSRSRSSGRLGCDP